MQSPVTGPPDEPPLNLQTFCRPSWRPAAFSDALPNCKADGGNVLVVLGACVCTAQGHAASSPQRSTKPQRLSPAQRLILCRQSNELGSWGRTDTSAGRTDRQLSPSVLPATGLQCPCLSSICFHFPICFCTRKSCLCLLHHAHPRRGRRITHCSWKLNHQTNKPARSRRDTAAPRTCCKLLCNWRNLRRGRMHGQTPFPLEKSSFLRC